MILWWYSWSEKFKTASPSRGLKGWSFVCLGSGSPERAPRPLSAEKGEGMDDKIFKSLLQNFSECLQPDNVNSWTSQKKSWSYHHTKRKKERLRIFGIGDGGGGKVTRCSPPSGPLPIPTRVQGWPRKYLNGQTRGSGDQRKGHIFPSIGWVSTFVIFRTAAHFDIAKKDLPKEWATFSKNKSTPNKFNFFQNTQSASGFLDLSFVIIIHYIPLINRQEDKYTQIKEISLMKPFDGILLDCTSIVFRL